MNPIFTYTVQSHSNNNVSHSYLNLIIHIVCDDSCDTKKCEGPDADECTACPSGGTKYLTDPPTSTCGTCGSKQYGKTADMTCYDCHTQCTTCSSDGNSVSTDTCECANKEEGGSCVAACSSGYFDFNSDSHCLGKINLLFLTLYFS